MKTLNTRVLATDLGVSLRTAQRYIQEGFLPAIQTRNDKGQVEYSVNYDVYQEWKNEHFKGIKRGQISKLKRIDKELTKSELVELSEEWLNALSLGTFNGKVYSPCTVSTYEYQISKYWKLLKTYTTKPYISSENLKSILEQIPIENYASRQKIYDAIWCFMKYLEDKKICNKEEMDKLRKLKPKRFFAAKKITYTEAQIESILKANGDATGKTSYDRLFTEALIKTLANTGLRVSELCDLKLNDVNLEQKIIYVYNGKGNKNRRIGINKEAQEVLERYLRARLAISTEDYFFVTKHGDKVKPNTLRHKWRRLANKLGFKITNHGFRRSFVTINNRKGKSLVDLQIACAHNDISMTRSYCMTSEDEVISAMQQW